ncbi:MAG TPA: hypothetical protein DEQ24_09610 [Enterococcus sp.]|nr:hypothetical protein [Enterococcus sp.]
MKKTIKQELLDCSSCWTTCAYYSGASRISAGISIRTSFSA